MTISNENYTFMISFPAFTERNNFYTVELNKSDDWVISNKENTFMFSFGLSMIDSVTDLLIYKHVVFAIGAHVS